MTMSGRDIYDNFKKHAQGTASWQAAQQAAADMARELPGQAADIKRLQDAMSTAWTGDAADAAQQGVTPLALEHINVADSLHTTQDLMSRQAASFHQAANTVRPMPPEPALRDPLAAIATGQSPDTMLSQMVQYNVAAQHNVDVMNNYHGASSYNTDNMPTAYGTLADNAATITVQPTQVAAGPSAGGARSPSGAPSSSVARPTTSARSATTSHSGSAVPSGSSGGDSSTAPGQNVLANTGGQTTTSGVGTSAAPGTSAGVSGTGGGQFAGGPPVSDGSGVVDGVPVAAGSNGSIVGNLGGDPSGDGAVGSGRMGGGTPGDGPGSRGLPGAGRVGGGATGEEPVPGQSALAEEAASATRGGAAGQAGLPGGLAGGGRRGERDDEHKRKYQYGPDADELFAGDQPKVAPEALGESAAARAVRHAGEAEGGH